MLMGNKVGNLAGCAWGTMMMGLRVAAGGFRDTLDVYTRLEVPGQCGQSSLLTFVSCHGLAPWSHSNNPIFDIQKPRPRLGQARPKPWMRALARPVILRGQSPLGSSQIRGAAPRPSQPDPEQHEFRSFGGRILISDRILASEVPSVRHLHLPRRRPDHPRTGLLLSSSGVRRKHG
jgi:hypothetical protein